MKTLVLILLNAGLLVSFFYMFRRRTLLSYHEGGRIWLTYLAVGIITLMDEFTSVFYAPAEAYRFIGANAVIFIFITSLLVRFISTRLTEIAEILEHNNLIGGGVYSFSYLVMGPTASFVAVSSIMVDYILTACLSAVSAVSNSTSLFPLSRSASMLIALATIWAVAGLNIAGIRENARFTFMIFVGAVFVMLNLVASGLLNVDAAAVARVHLAGTQTLRTLTNGSLLQDYGNFISSVAFCILAYSGVESVLQTAGYVKSWKEIRKAYRFLALSVGLVTPIVAALVLSSPIDFKKHEGDLITHYATLLNGVPFGIAVGALASFTLILAVNTAFVASSELIERVAHRYGFRWLIATNRRQSLYRIHICSALFFSIIILLTMGNQAELANMYALGLLASFCINMGSLILYRYLMGKSQGMTYSTSRLGTLILWVILVSCFLFLAIDKPRATMLWATATGLMLLLGSLVAKKRSPELKRIEQGDSETDMIRYLAQSEERDVHVFFRRSPVRESVQHKDNEAYVTFYSPRVGAVPPKTVPNHFRFPLTKITLYQRIEDILTIVESEMNDREVTVHFGWPLSSWFDRMSIGVMVYKMMKLPRLFPSLDFDIHYRNGRPGQRGKAHKENGTFSGPRIVGMAETRQLPQHERYRIQ